jgi:hypothetical protein
MMRPKVYDPKEQSYLAEQIAIGFTFYFLFTWWGNR